MVLGGIWGVLFSICSRLAGERAFESVNAPWTVIIASMTDSPTQHMQCMEVWGGSQRSALLWLHKQLVLYTPPLR